jgi:hypothetical protein
MFHNCPILHPLAAERLVESKNLRQPLRPVVTVPLSFDGKLLGGYTVNYQAGTKQITLYRNLLAAVLYEQGGVNIEEILVLYDLAQKMEEKRQRDKAFQEKYGDWLITSFGFIESLSPRDFPFLYQGQIEEAEKSLTPYLPSRQAYYGWRRNPVRVTPARVRLRNPLAPPTKLPAKRYVGVGYKDKGNRRDPATDGSPSWQEVATSSKMRNIESAPRTTILGAIFEKMGMEE